MRLKADYECIVAEGAGSPVELNLMDRDLSNIYVASEFNTKIILVADIERGGVFASIWGVYNLLPEALRNNVMGVIVNKFRGDMSLFDEGVEIIEKQFKIPVLGVLPFKDFNLGFEDSQSLFNYTQDTSKSLITVGVIALPHMSNFTDFEPLIADREIDMRFISSVHETHSCDLVVIPGTKRTIDDLAWLKERGFESHLKQNSKPTVAICGGYQMLFEQIIDDEAIESNEACRVEGLALLEGSVNFRKEKIVSKGSFEVFGEILQGYEIHHGIAKSFSTQKDNLYGTFMHGLFDNNSFRMMLFKGVNREYKGFDFSTHKAEKTKEFALHVKENIDLAKIIEALKKP